MSQEPTHGYTKAGNAVHGKTVDHLPDHNWYARFNKRVAVWLTKSVGTMTCFWLFLALSLISAPTVFSSGSLLLMVSWLTQTCIQLVLLPGLMVGQQLGNEAADVRSTKQFEDTELIADRLDTKTQGGLSEVLEAISALSEKLPARKAAK